CASCGGVVNVGVPGYTTYQGLMLLREVLQHVQPRVVVLSFHASDELIGDAPAVTDACPAGIVPALRRHSAVSAWIRWLLDRSPRDWSTRQARTSVARYQRSPLAMASEAARVGATPIFLNVGFGPSPAAGVDGRRLRRGRYEGEYQTSMRDASRKFGAPLSEFIGVELDRTTMLDDVHPSVAGYRQMALRVAQTITDARLLE